MTLSRRSFFTGLATLIAAPAIVRTESLMKLAPTRIIRPTFGLDLACGADTTIVTRLDVLYGSMYVRPEWTVLVPNITLDEYSERILAPMVNRLRDDFIDTVMYGIEGNSFRLNGLLHEARATNSHE